MAYRGFVKISFLDINSFFIVKQFWIFMLLSTLFKKGISHSHKIGFLQSTVKFVDQRRASSWKLRQNRKDQKIECRVVKKKCIWKMSNPSLRVRPSAYAIHQCTPNGVIHWSSSYFSTTYSILPQWLKIHPQMSHVSGKISIFGVRKKSTCTVGKNSTFYPMPNFVSSLEFPKLHLFNLPGLDTYFVLPKTNFFPW